jgi:hypothetical protein
MERDDGAQEMEKIMKTGFPHHGWMSEWMKLNWLRTFIISFLPFHTFFGSFQSKGMTNFLGCFQSIVMMLMCFPHHG